MSVPAYATAHEGLELPTLTVRVGRADLVRYAGASGDFNPLHWNPRVAASLGLPDVIAHGMLTMAHAARVLTAWVGDPGRIEDYSVRFTKPVVVPDDGSVPDYENGTEVVYTGTVAALLDAPRVRVQLEGRCGDDKILGAARATVRLDP